MLTLEEVTVRYDGKAASAPAVDGVTIDVDDAEVVALLGPSGCGKSTLLRAIAGIEPITSGRIYWDGVDLAKIPVHRRGFGLMFQDGVLFPHRSVAGNVGYGLRAAGARAATPDAQGRVAGLLDMVGLAGYGERRVTTLSGGEAQRVALARALAPSPRLLLLDEPLAALDTSLRATLLADLARVLESTRTTALFVTHDQDEAVAIADRVALMRRGRIVQIGTPNDVWSRPVDDEAAVFLGKNRTRGRRLDSGRPRYDVSLADSDPVADSNPAADSDLFPATTGSPSAPPRQVVVAGAVIADGRMLIARRTAPPDLAGKWELPGGKVEPGESEQAALAREFAEELGLDIVVGPRIGAPIPLGVPSHGRDAGLHANRELHVFRAEPASREASYLVDPEVHTEVRWVGANDLDTVDWVPADRDIVDAVRPLLNRGAGDAADFGLPSGSDVRRSAASADDIEVP